MYTPKKNKTSPLPSPLRILCTLMLQITPLSTLTSICMWHEESPPPKVRLSLLIYLDVKFSFVCDLRFKSFFFLVIFLKIRHTILGLEIKCSLLNIVCFKIRLSLDFDFKINYLCSLSQNHNYLCSLTQDQVLNILCFKVSFFAYCLKTILFLSLFFIFCLWL